MSANATGRQTPEPVPCALCGRPVQHDRGELIRTAGANRIVCAAGDISGCRL